LMSASMNERSIWSLVVGIVRCVGLGYGPQGESVGDRVTSQETPRSSYTLRARHLGRRALSRARAPRERTRGRMAGGGPRLAG
jgi:hypothetical protein